MIMENIFFCYARMMQKKIKHSNYLASPHHFVITSIRNKRRTNESLGLVSQLELPHMLTMPIGII